MNRGLITKIAYEVWPPTLIFILAMFALELLLANVLASFSQNLMDQVMQVPFVQNLIKGLLGTDMPVSFDPRSFSAFAWVHPAVLTLLWAQTITFCTRTPAAEIDRGTIDFLLGLPVSRFRLFCAETLVWLTCAAAMIGMGLFGFWIGNFTIPVDSRADFSRIVVIALNCLCLYLSVGSLAFLASALSERRGKAIAAVVAIVLASFLLNFLTQFSDTAAKLGFLSLMHYHRPLQVLHQSGWPAADMIVLLTIAAGFWLAAAIVFTRRDIRTT
ncbi:MAG: ABC transporter permease subunit [Phycisphaerae bacterium]